ncbi:MAG: FKBP-type peptidyl-prolyl cis-trans isomerase [Bacteroidota bacterium]
MKRTTILICLFACVSFACEEQKLQSQIDRETIEEYLAANNIDAIEDQSGLFYIVTQDGTGEERPGPNSTVEVKYRGYFTDGTVFDQSRGDNTAEVDLNNTILGWRIGVPLMKKGEKTTFFLPSGLAYGFRGSGPVPPNTVIIFDVELFNFSG